MGHQGISKLVILLLLILGLSTLSSAQEKSIELYITHSITDEPIAYANLWLPKWNIGGATNLDGRCNLIIPSFSKSDTLVCSFIGFEKELVPIEIGSSGIIEISLSPSYELLDEVVVSAHIDDSIDPKKLIEQAISKKYIKQNYPQTSQNYLISYRELLQEDGMNITLNEAVADIIYSSYPQKVSFPKGIRKSLAENETQTTKSNRDEESTKARLLSFNSQYFKYYLSQDDRCLFRQARFSDNHSTHGLRFSIANGPMDLLTMDKVKYRYDMLDPKVIDKYQYSLDNIISIGDEEVYVIGFKPIHDSTDRRFGLNKRIKEALLAGTIYVQKEDLAILKFEAQLHAKTRYEAQRAWQKYAKSNTVMVNYKKQRDQKYHLHKIVTEQDYLDERFENSFLVKRQLNILNIGGEPEYDRVISETKISYFANHLRDMITPIYDGKDWEYLNDYDNYPALDRSILKDLSNSIPLEEQFMKNSYDR